MEKTKGQANGEQKALPVEGDAWSGLTKREYFAAKTMQGLMVQGIPGRHNMNEDFRNKDRAIFAVNMADELLEALANER